jgi:hypothetical protein
LPIKNGLPVRIHLAKSSEEEDQGNTHRVWKFQTPFVLTPGRSKTRPEQCKT